MSLRNRAKQNNNHAEFSEAGGGGSTHLPDAGFCQLDSQVCLVKGMILLSHYDKLEHTLPLRHFYRFMIDAVFDLLKEAENLSIMIHK